MAPDYYNGYGGGPSGKRRRSLVMRLVDLALTLVTHGSGRDDGSHLFRPLCRSGQRVVLSRAGAGRSGGLRRVGRADALLDHPLALGVRGAMLVVVVAGLFKVSLFWRPETRRSYATETAFDRAAVKVMSYNVRSFYGEDGRSSVDDILRLIEEQAPDLICLQEFNARLAEQSEEFSLLGEKYEIAHFGRTQAPDSVYGSTLTILSKYRILRSDTVLTPSSSVWADVIVGEDTVRVFNNHLRSTAINASDNQFITSHQFLSDTARETKIRSIVTRLRENSVLRAAQVDSIAQVVGATRTRRIVCGDFNDTPMSYVYRTMARGLRDAFRECGSGYSHTFRGFYNTLRIDYVLSGGFEPLSYEVLPVDYSDHHPVVVRLRKSS